MTQPVIYDEALVPDYTLPDPLRLLDGTVVDSPAMWTERRRPELLDLFAQEVYGRAPARPENLEFVVQSDALALDGRTRRIEFALALTAAPDSPQAHVLIYRPQPPPKGTFLALNFRGNHTIQADPGIALSTSWMPDGEGIVNHRATAATRGTSASRWAVARIVERGYALATVYCGDIMPDRPDGFTEGVYPVFASSGDAERAPDAWGALSAWAWGLRRVMDYFERTPEYGPVAVMGHSRLGKAAVWAGAQDERFAMVISNNSGCGGAALSRRRFGETVEAINTRFPHWFCPHFPRYNGHEDALPVDQHLLLALVAPRPLYVASAAEDLWSDPYGEFLGAFHASPVYELLGQRGLPVTNPPGLNQPVMGTIGYHIRSGAHDVTTYDWEQYLDFAELHLR
jgi:hypothetical protein